MENSAYFPVPFACRNSHHEAPGSRSSGFKGKSVNYIVIVQDIFALLLRDFVLRIVFLQSFFVMLLM